MTLSLVAVVVLILGLVLHWAATGSGKSGAGTVAELGKAMIWVGLFFVVLGLYGHGGLNLR